MYKSFRVKNFRCFRDLEISDLGRVNLIAGKNNTGKTALMEAMYVHSGNRESKTLLRSSQPRPTAPHRSHVAASSDEEAASVVGWDSVFNDFDSSDDIVLSGESYAAEHLLLSGPYASTVTLAAKSQTSYDFDDILFQLRVSDLYRLKNIDVLAISSDYSRQSSYFAILDGRIVQSRVRTKPLFVADFLYPRQVLNEGVESTRFSNMRKRGELQTLLRALQDIEPRLTGLELWFDGQRPLIKCEVGLRQPVSLGDMGDGINRVASLVLAISELPNGVIFIDEIENGIHYSVQRQVWKAIGQVARELDIQVFATTHSLEMIRAAYEAFNEAGKLDEFRYHRLDRDRETGDIEAVTYNQRAVEAVATFDFDFEVRG